MLVLAPAMEHFTSVATSIVVPPRFEVLVPRPRQVPICRWHGGRVPNLDGAFEHAGTRWRVGASRQKGKWYMAIPYCAALTAMYLDIVFAASSPTILWHLWYLWYLHALPLPPSYTSHYHSITAIGPLNRSKIPLRPPFPAPLPPL